MFDNFVIFFILYFNIILHLQYLVVMSSNKNDLQNIYNLQVDLT